MLAGLFHEGSGLGNQLFRYITTRMLAEDKGYEWGMLHPENFKGASFMNLNMGNIVGALLPSTKWLEKDIRDAANNDVRSYDPEINFVEDNTIIDGSFEDPRYWEHRMEDIGKWLVVEPVEVPDDVCVIGFRGGEYALYPELFLTREYWVEAIETMHKKGISKFEVHTDDTELAALRLNGMVPSDTKFIHDIGLNWRSVRYAKHAVIANSSFYVLPRLLQHHENKEALTIAPRYWGRRNTRVWAPQGNFYRPFLYV